MKRKMTCIVLLASMLVGCGAAGNEVSTDAQESASNVAAAEDSKPETNADGSAIKNDATDSDENDDAESDASAGNSDASAENSDGTETDNSSAVSSSAEAGSNSEAKEDGDMATEIVIPEIDITQNELPDNEAIQFVQDMKLGFNLGNTFDAYSDTSTGDDLEMETIWGNPETSKEFIQAVHANGFDTIRIPVSWHNHVDEDYNINEAWLSRVQEVVDYAIDDGMYVIINIHHDNHEEANCFYPDEEHKEQSLTYVEKIWTQLSERFKDYDNKLIFESLNEPRLIGHANEWWIDANNEDCKEAISVINELNQKFVDVVRSSGGNNADRYLMCPGYCASPDGALNDGFVLPTDTADNKIIISVHAYTPYSFALEMPGVDTFDADSYVSTKDIDNFMDKLYDKYISQGIPVLIGEAGCMNKNNNVQARVKWAAYYTAKARSCGLTFLWWDNGAFAGNGELFGLMRRSDGTVVYQDILDAMLKYCE